MANAFDLTRDLYEKSAMLRSFYPESLNQVMKWYNEPPGYQTFIDISKRIELYTKPASKFIDIYESSVFRSLRDYQKMHDSLNYEAYVPIDTVMRNLFGRATDKFSPDEEEEIIINDIQRETTELLEQQATKQFVTVDDLHILEQNIIAAIDRKLNDVITPRTATRWKAFRKFIIQQLLVPFIFVIIPMRLDKSATKDDLKITGKHIIDTLTTVIEAQRVMKVVMKNVWLREHAKFSSRKKILITTAEKVEVIDSIGNWAKIRVIDKEGFLVEGWLPKKYLHSLGK